MTSFLEFLPVELLTRIASCLALADVSVLMQTSKTLHLNLESSLYHSREARNDALTWACSHGHGHTRTIRRLITLYDSSPSTVDNGLTLKFALRSRSLEAFKLLLELGARVDGRSPHEIEALVRRLTSVSANHDFARAFYEAGLAAQLSRSLLDRSLLMLVRAYAPVDLVQLVLDHGARVSVSHSVFGIDSHKVWLNPLSASVVCSSRTLFDLLLQEGASIHGTEVQNPRRMPLHVPVYAAAYSMVEHGTAMVQACLDSGADVNHFDVIPSPATFNRYYYGTPLLGYLDSIASWPAKTAAGDHHDVLLHLQFLFDRGAMLPDNLSTAPFPGPYGRFDQQTAPHSTLNLLLDKMTRDNNTFGQLDEPQFQAVAKLLIRHGALFSKEAVAAKRIRDLLLEYDHRSLQDRVLVHPLLVNQAWRSFVRLLLDSAFSDKKTNSSILDVLLSDYIYKRGTDPIHPPTDLTFETIAVLISHGGANINAATSTENHPILHRLCHYYHLDEATDGVSRRAHNGTSKVLEERSGLVRVLIERHGADPDLRAVYSGGLGREGKTAEEILSGGWAGEGNWCYSDEGREVLGGLMEEIRRAKRRASGYSGGASGP